MQNEELLMVFAEILAHVDLSCVDSTLVEFVRMDLAHAYAVRVAMALVRVVVIMTRVDLKHVDVALVDLEHGGMVRVGLAHVDIALVDIVHVDSSLGKCNLTSRTVVLGWKEK